MMCCMLLVPPLFTTGFIFDATREHTLCDGTTFIEHSIYATKVFHVILLVLMSFFGLIIPYFKPNLNTAWKWVSCLAGSWFLWGLIYESINFVINDETLKTIEDNQLMIKAIVIFTLAFTFIITHSIWHKEQKSQS